MSMSLICVPMAVGQALYPVWIYGRLMCKVTAFLQGVAVAASIYTIAVLSVDRLLAIRHPMLFRSVSGSGVAVRIIVVIWIVSMGIMSPLLFVRNVQTFPLLMDQTVDYCVEQWAVETHRQVYDICLFGLVYIIPGVVICSAYGLIGKELWRQDENLNRTESETSKGIGKHVMNSRKRVARMLVALAVVFAVCWLPFYVVTIYIDFNFHTKQSAPFLAALPFTILLGHANSALNPILYFYSSKSFRTYLFRALKCKKVRSRHCPARNPHPQTKEENGGVHIPLLRLGTNTNNLTRSTGGSFRFSRSSSLKSTNASLKSKDMRTSAERLSFKNRNCLPKDKILIQVDVCDNDNKGNSNVQGVPNQDHPHTRDFMDRKLSIPTTINEESSRIGSISPLKPPHSFLINKIPEVLEQEERESSERC